MGTSVRRQLIAHFVLFALALGALFAAVTLLVFHRVEDRMVQRRLEQLLAGEPGAAASPVVDFVGPPGEAPETLRQRLADLPPGLYEWEEDDRELHVLLAADDTTGQAAVAIASFPESEVSQGRLGIALAVGVAATSLLALLLARTLALRIVSPIERLTGRLAQGSLDAVVSDELVRELRDDEIGTLARALQSAGRELTASAERERRFLREASHELRTPITVIQGVSDLLRESIDTDDELTRGRLERLDRGLRRMNTSVLSLLAMARAEHRLTVTDMPPFAQQLDDLIEEARSLTAPKVEVMCEAAAEPITGIAASMLIVVLSNLTRNAVQHTEAGKVRVVVEADRARVVDDGPGLPAEILGQLRRGGPQPSLGIGLATVQRICKRFDWQFEVDCPPGGGTIATVTGWSR
ncbi:MAG: HAMP domain-containing sensor histidine kinase [Acidobacteriota bacterium]